jgi:peptidoglycan/LPS O-acetylase OafA/YrhL
LAIALSLYAVRLFYFKLENTNNTLNGVECSLWIIAILGFAATHLNQDSTLLRRLSPAVYPIYILHLPIQFAIASILFKSTMPAFAKLLLLLLGTFTICWALYECIRRIPPLRPLFGMKYRTT